MDQQIAINVNTNLKYFLNTFVFEYLSENLRKQFIKLFFIQIYKYL